MTVPGLVVRSHHNPSLSPVSIATDVISKVSQAMNFQEI